MTGFDRRWARRQHLHAAAIAAVLALVVLGTSLLEHARSPETAIVVGSSAPEPSAPRSPNISSTTPTTESAPAPVTVVSLPRPPRTIGHPPQTATSVAALAPRFPPTSTAQSLPPITGALRERLVASTLIPPGFSSNGLDDGLVNAPGKLDSAGARWTRALRGGRADYISLWATRFSTPDQATDFNARFAGEYGAGATGVVSAPIPGVPGGVAYLTNSQTATAWFNVGPVAVGVYVVDTSEQPLTLAKTLARAEYGLLG